MKCSLIKALYAITQFQQQTPESKQMTLFMIFRSLTKCMSGVETSGRQSQEHLPQLTKVSDTIEPCMK